MKFDYKTNYLIANLATIFMSLRVPLVCVGKPSGKPIGFLWPWNSDHLKMAKKIVICVIWSLFSYPITFDKLLSFTVKKID